MLKAFGKAVEQLQDRALRRIVWIGLLFAAVVFALLWGGMYLLLAHSSLFQTGWLETAVDVLGGLATIVLTWLFFPAVVTSIMGFYLDDAADAVEKRHFPDLPLPRRQPIQEIILSSLRFLSVTAALNVVALLFLLLPAVFPFVFYGINGYLLGREYFEVVALRRLDPTAAARFRRSHRLQVFLAGLVIAFLLTLPFVNLLAPVIGTAAMVHIFHGMNNRR